MNETIDSKVKGGFWRGVGKSAAVVWFGLALGGGFGTLVKKAYHEIRSETYLVVNKAELERLNSAVEFYERYRDSIEAMRMMKEIIAEKDRNGDGVIDCYESGRLQGEYSPESLDKE